MKLNINTNQYSTWRYVQALIIYLTVDTSTVYDNFLANCKATIFA